MVDVATLAIQVNSQPAVKAVGDLDRLTAAAGKADVAADRLAANAGKVGPAMAGAGQNSRMFAMQLSQVAQQTSATGNFVQALAIQLPDMALGFGAVGIAAGVVASVALPALVSMMGSTSSSAQDAKDRIDELGEAVSAYREAVENAGTPTEVLIEKYGRLSEAARAALAAQAELQMVVAIEGTNAAIEAMLTNLTTFREFATGNFLEVAESVRVLTDSFGMTSQQIGAVNQAFRDLAAAQGLEDQARAARQVQEALIGVYGSVAAMPQPLREAYGQLSQVVIAAGETNDLIGEMPGLLSSAAAAADAVAGAVGGIAGAASNAADAVAGLATRLWEAAQARAAAALSVENDTGGMAAQYAQYGRGRQIGERLARESGSLYGGDSVLPTSRGGVGSGGGAADQYAADLEALVVSLETEREVLDTWYEENQALLADRRAEEILGTQAHKDALLQLEAEYQQRLAEIEGTSQSQRISDTASFFGSLASIASAGGQKTAKAVAAFQAIEGTINAYGAAIKALNTPGITLAGRFAAYASVLAAGLRGVAAIRSAGGVGGGGGSVGAVAAQGQQQAQQQTVEYIVRGIDKDALYTGEMFSRIFDGLTEEAQKRGVQTAVRFV